MYKKLSFSMHPLVLPIVLWILTIGWFLVAWTLSSQSGSETGSLSLRISNWIARLISLPEASIPAFHIGLRKSAHIIVFFVLSLFACTAVHVTFSNRYAILWPLLFCCLFAVLDEVRKATIPGRHCSLAEAGLNALGCLLGAGIVWGIMRLKRAKP